MANNFYQFINQKADLTFNIGNGYSVEYNGKIHILGSGTNHYSWDKNTDTWTKESTLPTSVSKTTAVVVVWRDCIYLLQNTSWWRYDGTSWETVSHSDNVPSLSQGYNIGVVCGNTLHILGGSDSGSGGYWWSKKHYGITYFNDQLAIIEYSDLPISVSPNTQAAVVKDNKIYLYNGYDCLIFESGSWTTYSNSLPVSFNAGGLVVLNDEIHIISNGAYSYLSYHNDYSQSESDWVQDNNLPATIRNGCVVAYNGEIHHFPYKSSSRYYHYVSSLIYNKIVYGDKTILDMSDATVSRNDVVESKTFYLFNGKRSSGLRPSYYERQNKKIYKNTYEITLSEGQDTSAFWLGGQCLTLRNPSATLANAQLVSIKTDGTTESVINLLTSLVAGYRETFKIHNVKYFDKWTAIIIYSYATAASAAANQQYAYYAREIHIKKDGSLYQYTQYQISGAFSAGYTKLDNYILVPMLYNNTSVESIVFYKYYTNTSTGNLTLQYKYAYSYLRMNAADQCAWILSNATNMATASVNTRPCWPGKNVKIKGGLFYLNNTGVASLFLMTNYYGSYSYPINGTIATLTDTSDTEAVKKLTPSFSLMEYSPGTIYNPTENRQLAVMGLLNDKTTLVVLRAEGTCENFNEGVKHINVYVDLWELNTSLKWLTYKYSYKINENEGTASSLYTWDEVPNCKFAWLNNNILYYQESTISTGGSIKRFQLTPTSLIEIEPVILGSRVGYNTENVVEQDAKSSHTNLFEEVFMSDI